VPRAVTWLAVERERFVALEGGADQNELDAFTRI
jgi:hypothetical protein